MTLDEIKSSKVIKILETEPRVTEALLIMTIMMIMAVISTLVEAIDMRREVQKEIRADIEMRNIVLLELHHVT